MLDEYGMNNWGFTLIELLIAMAITTIVSAGIFSAYRSQQNAQLAQKQIVEMQQNLRAALYMMTKDIRMAGCDPDDTNSVGIIAAGDGTNGNPLIFNFFGIADSDGIDNDSDGVVDETGELALQTIQYDLYDAYGDGDSDIGRKVGAANRQACGENIVNQPLFSYFDGNGNLISSPGANLSDIRAVQITITATVDANEKNYTNGNRTLTTMIKCRNLGL